MKNLFRFQSIAVMAVILSSNAAYAQNNTCLTQGESNLNAGKNKEAIAAVSYTHLTLPTIYSV